MQCTVEDCGRSVANKMRGLCSSHYARWQRWGDPTAGASPRFKDRVCSVEGCGRPHDARDFCRLHLRRFAKYGDPRAETPPRPQSGPRVEVTGYRNAHKRIDRWRDAPSRCDYCGAVEGRFQWALKAGLEDLLFEGGLAYSLNVHDYIRLCMRCHAQQEHLVQVRLLRTCLCDGYVPAPAKVQEATG